MKHFTMNELVRSNTAINNEIDNEPTEDIKKNLIDLVENVLDPLREAYGHPIRVNSGYRSKELNKSIGGVPTSQHCLGQAADITTGTKNGNKDLIAIAKSINLPYDQLIDEKNGTWVHISYGPRNRHQFLRS